MTYESMNSVRQRAYSKGRWWGGRRLGRREKGEFKRCQELRKVV